MTERTGATDAQIESAARNRFNDINHYYGNEWYDKRTNLQRQVDINDVTDYAEYLVPVGMVIARAADVLTDEHRAAIGRITAWSQGAVKRSVQDVYGPLMSGQWEADIESLTAIAEGGTE